VGDRTTLGIRPEHLRLDPSNPTLMGEVLVMERLGGETFLYVKIEGGDTLTVQTDGDNPSRLHDRIPIYINGDLCHLFDQQGEAIPKARRHHLTLNESHEQQYQN
jgi:multiple sugar transport system ATP-binding protein